LHETLEGDENSEGRPLSRVIDFLRQFHQFPDVIMRCARKTDPGFWKQLFDIAGQPKQLFEQCMQHGRVQTAASYLRILQHIEGQRDARFCALKLLDESLNREDLEVPLYSHIILIASSLFVISCDS
jgi:hypothetical protein